MRGASIWLLLSFLALLWAPAWLFLALLTSIAYDYECTYIWVYHPYYIMIHYSREYQIKLNEH